MNRRCKYHCTVEDAEGAPSFTIRVEDVEQKEPIVFRGKTPRGNAKHSFRAFLSPITRTYCFDRAYAALNPVKQRDTANHSFLRCDNQ